MYTQGKFKGINTDKYVRRLKMEIKEEEVERPEPYPDDDDPLSWSVKLVNKTLTLSENAVAFWILSKRQA